MSADEPVPRLPRTRGLKLAGPQLVRIALTGALLVLVIVVQRPCADSVSRFVTSFGAGSGSAVPAQLPRPGAIDEPAARGSAADYESLRSDMSDEEIRAAIARARAKAAARAGSGAGSAGGDGPGRGSGAARGD